MQPYQWTIFGLFLNIIGVFFLSVEAITLPNFRKLRDMIFIPLHHAILPTRMTVVERQLTNEEHHLFRSAFFNFYISHSIGGLIGTTILIFVFRKLGVDILLLARTLFGSTSNKLLISLVIATAVFTFVLPVIIIRYGRNSTKTFLLVVLLNFIFPISLLLLAVGEVMHFGSIWLSKAVIKVLNFIDNKTPDGTIGVIGFLLALIGFVLQLIGIWIGRSSNSM